MENKSRVIAVRVHSDMYDLILSNVSHDPKKSVSGFIRECVNDRISKKAKINKQKS